jgi:NAD(P)-dependent dehydrogenase (short-subunit alcohol dehydrogenase family)
VVSVQLQGSKALVTGGASGLGAATARRLAESGVAVAILDLPGDRGEAVAESLGTGSVFIPADVTKPDQVERAVATAAEALGGLHFLVNAAGIGPAHRLLSRSGDLHPLDLFELTIRINLVGVFDVTRHAAKVMSANEPGDDGERGAVVNVASVAAFDGQIGQVAYSASKGGIVGMTLPLARDLSAIGVRVNTIAPGIMDTPMLAALPEPARISLGEQVLFPKRLGRPEEFADLACFLLGHPYINGEVVRMDGGIRMAPK